MDALSRRDTVTAERWRARIGSGTGTAAALAVLTDAVTTAQRGQTDSALVRTAPLLRLDSSGLVRAPFARAVLYLRRGEWQLAAGDSAAAERSWLWTDAWDVEGWPRGAAQAGEVDAVLSAIVRLRRAAVSLGWNGRNPDGCRLVERVRQLWSGAEPAFVALRAVVDSQQKACE